MARVRSFTAERMLQIENETVVDGTVDAGGRLHLVRRDGIIIDAGRVTGDKGDPGSGVSDITVTYQRGVSPTEAPTGTWTTTIPVVPTGEYLWIRTVTEYRNPANPDEMFETTSFVVIKQPEAGTDGEPGRGIESIVVTYQSGTSGVDAPTGTWTETIPNVPPGRFLWTRTYTKFTDGGDSTAYSVAKQGADGAPGDGGSSSYIHVAYAQNSSGTEGFSKTDPTGRSYMGVYVDDKQADSDDPSLYSWSKIQGATGVGITSTQIRYNSSASGTTTPTANWLEVIPEVQEGWFLWTRTVLNFTDGASSTTYLVAKQGSSGADGVGVRSTIVDYQTSLSGVEEPSGAWTTTIPATPQGLYLWTRSRVTYTDDRVSTTYSVSRNGSDGSDGDDGSDGASVSGAQYYYRIAESKPSKPTVETPSGWVTEEPGYSPGVVGNLYFVIKTTLTDGSFEYSDVSMSSAYTAAKIAYQLAESKSRTIRSDQPATNPGDYEANTTWWQYDGIDLISMWFHDGTNWVKQELSDALFNNIDAAKIGTGYLSADRIDAETIRTSHLASDVGSNLDISSNQEIIMSAGRTDDLNGRLNNTDQRLEQQRSVFIVTENGARVSTGDRQQYLDMTPESIALVQEGVEVSKWESGRFYVQEAVFNSAMIANHYFEASGSQRTIARPRNP